MRFARASLLAVFGHINALCTVRPKSLKEELSPIPKLFNKTLPENSFLLRNWMNTLLSELNTRLFHDNHF